MPRFAVILPAAGQSQRFGRPKLLEPLDGQSVIGRSVAAFLARADVTSIVIATRDQPLMEAIIPADPRIVFAAGGESRAHSVRNALEQIPADVEFIAVHDAARPLVTASLIDRVLAAAMQNGAAGPALPVHLHLRQAAGPLPARSSGSIPRHGLFAMQTPQIMRAQLLRKAFSVATELKHVTDDLQLLETIGVHATLVAGEEQNLKITTPSDLLLAAILLNSAQNTSQA